MTDKLTVLKQAKDLISDPKNWTQGTLARNEYGERVSPIAISACKWCAVGALDEAAPPREGRDPELVRSAQAALNMAAMKLFNYPIIDINDRDSPNSYSNVLRVYDVAIQKEEANAKCTGD